MDLHDMDTDPDIVGAYYDNFIQQAAPFILERETWLDLVKTKLVKEYEVRSNGQRCLKNAVGAVQPVTLFKNTKEVAAFICQGLEAAFINYLMLLGKEYKHHRYEVRSLEHDGLVVDGWVPEGIVNSGLSCLWGALGIGSVQRPNPHRGRHDLHQII